MLFNSHIFIFAFMPVVILGTLGLHRYAGRRSSMAWMLISSLAFYGWWNPAYLPLIMASVAVNFMAGRFIESERSRTLLVVGICLNLGALIWFKYSGFAVGNANSLLGTQFKVPEIVLPLAVSFFTFQQIAYLVDIWRGADAENDLLDYAVFVTFFPQLIAGPIVQSREMLPQFKAPNLFAFRREDLAVGGALFLFGLFEKVVLADGVAVYAGPVFEAAQLGLKISLFEAWGGALAYTYQVYFDFAGYSTMAIGLGRIFGLTLPVNFDTPYQATSIIDFWRRWHMTLSRFLKHYLYFPLGGSRVGRYRLYLNLMITMVLGGLWHGAGWNFAVWGALHGVFLIVNVAWRRWRSGSLGHRPVRRYEVLGGWALTFTLVVLARVFFRTESLGAAMGMLDGAFGVNGAILDNRLSGLLGWLEPWVRFEGTHAGYFNLHGVPWLVALSVVCWFAPSPLELFTGYRPALAPDGGYFSRARGFELRWKPTARWATVVALVGAAAIMLMARVSEFIYYQF